VTRYVVDLSERVLGVYILALFSLLLASGFNLADTDALKAAAIAAVPAAIEVARGAIARKVGNPDSAGFTV
jgi:hypothetical protein